jgi:hypothetical protein
MMAHESPRAPGAKLAAHPLTHRDLLAALIQCRCLAATVPKVLDVVEEDPLASSGQFAGDLLRGLMEVPGSYWGRHPKDYARYRAALRHGALHRRRLPPELRMNFWEPLCIDD